MEKKEEPLPTINLNIPVTIRFPDGEQMSLVIFNPQDKNKIPKDQNITFWCNQESPIGQALLGHKLGDKVRYSVGNQQLEVEIVGIKHPGEPAK